MPETEPTENSLTELRLSMQKFDSRNRSFSPIKSKLDVGPSVFDKPSGAERVKSKRRKLTKASNRNSMSALPIDQVSKFNMTMATLNSHLTSMRQVRKSMSNQNVSKVKKGAKVLKSPTAVLPYNQNKPTSIVEVKPGKSEILNKLV